MVAVPVVARTFAHTMDSIELEVPVRRTANGLGVVVSPNNIILEVGPPASSLAFSAGISRMRARARRPLIGAPNPPPESNIPEGGGGGGEGVDQGERQARDRGGGGEVCVRRAVGAVSGYALPRCAERRYACAWGWRYGRRVVVVCSTTGLQDESA